MLQKRNNLKPGCMPFHGKEKPARRSYVPFGTEIGKQCLKKSRKGHKEKEIKFKAHKRNHRPRGGKNEKDRSSLRRGGHGYNARFLRPAHHAFL
jgi:hypothetical protein